MHMSKKIMYSFKIEKELLNKAKKEAGKLGFTTSTFIRQAIIDKLNKKNRLDIIEKRLDKLEIKQTD